jgi:hypothetical protein
MMKIITSLGIMIKFTVFYKIVSICRANKVITQALIPISNSNKDEKNDQ